MNTSPGDFGTHSEHYMLKNMYDAITKRNLWSWLSNFTPEEGKGFMFTFTPEIMAIVTETESDKHSGSSFAFCMRHMEYIAKHGWDEYSRTYIKLI